MSGGRTTWSVTWEAEVEAPESVGPVAAAAMALDGILLKQDREFRVSGPHGVAYWIDLCRDDPPAEPILRALGDAEFWLTFASVARAVASPDDNSLEHGPDDMALSSRLFDEGTWRFGQRGMNHLTTWIARYGVSYEALVHMAQNQPDALTRCTQGNYPPVQEPF